MRKTIKRYNHTRHLKTSILLLEYSRIDCKVITLFLERNKMIDGKKPTTIVTVMLKVQHEDIPKEGTASSWVESQMGWLDLDGIQFVEVMDELN
jgi:hypothetical protein